MVLGNVLIVRSNHPYPNIIVTSISFLISAHDINDSSSLALPNPVYPGFAGTFFFSKERISGRRSDLLA